MPLDCSTDGNKVEELFSVFSVVPRMKNCSLMLRNCFPSVVDLYSHPVPCFFPACSLACVQAFFKPGIVLLFPMYLHKPVFRKLHNVEMEIFWKMKGVITYGVGKPSHFFRLVS